MEITYAQTKFETYLLTEKRVSRNTLQAYTNDLSQFFSYLATKKVGLPEVSLDTLKDFLFHLKQEKLSARSMSRKISTLKLFFAYMHEQCNIPNSAEHLIFPKLEKRLPNVIPEQEIEQLLQIADQDSTILGLRNKIMLYLLYVSGMRISELTGMKTTDIHFDTGFIAVQGKGGKGRMIPLPHSMLAALRHYQETIHPQLLASKKQIKTDYLFPTLYGNLVKAISRQSLWMILKNLWGQTGIKRSISPHTLRHSLATHLLKRGANLRSLQLLLGHENLATVHIYTHLDTGYVRTVYDKKHPRS